VGAKGNPKIVEHISFNTLRTSIKREVAKIPVGYMGNMFATPGGLYGYTSS
jgi:hypothetical protein